MQFAIINNLEFLHSYLFSSIHCAEPDQDQIVYRAPDNGAQIALINVNSEDPVNVYFEGRLIAKNFNCPEMCLYVTDMENLNPNYLKLAQDYGDLKIVDVDRKIDLSQAIEQSAFKVM